MKTTPRLMALVWLLEFLDLIRVRVPKDKVQKSLTIPHNPNLGHYVAPQAPGKFTLFIAIM